MSRLEILAIAMLVVLAALGLSYWMTWRDGYHAAEARAQQRAAAATEKQRSREQLELAALKRDQVQREQDYETEVRKMRAASDECARRLAPRDVLDGLR